MSHIILASLVSLSLANAIGEVKPPAGVNPTAQQTDVAKRELTEKHLFVVRVSSQTRR